MSVIPVIGIFLALLLTVLPWYKIFSKAGYSGCYSLVMLIPILNIIALFIFAFSEWPIERRA